MTVEQNKAMILKLEELIQQYNQAAYEVNQYPTGESQGTYHIMLLVLEEVTEIYRIMFPSLVLVFDDDFVYKPITKYIIKNEIHVI